MKCSIETCTNNAYCRGWCNKHYLRWYNHGDPLQTATPNRRANGTGSFTNGYVLLPQVPSMQVLEHRRVAEAALGRQLGADEIVHHLNKDTLDNRPTNLLICTKAYHKLLHARMDAQAACGNANYRKCPHCKIYDDPINMSLHGKQYRHKACHAKSMQIWKTKYASIRV